jgi:hypothetical protein
MKLIRHLYNLKFSLKEKRLVFDAEKPKVAAGEKAEAPEKPIGERVKELDDKAGKQIATITTYIDGQVDFDIEDKRELKKLQDAITEAKGKLNGLLVGETTTVVEGKEAEAQSKYKTALADFDQALSSHTQIFKGDTETGEVKAEVFLGRKKVRIEQQKFVDAKAKLTKGEFKKLIVENLPASIAAAAGERIDGLDGKILDAVNALTKDKESALSAALKDHSKVESALAGVDAEVAKLTTDAVQEKVKELDKLAKLTPIVVGILERVQKELPKSVWDAKKGDIEKVIATAYEKGKLEPGYIDKKVTQKQQELFVEYLWSHDAIGPLLKELKGKEGTKLDIKKADLTAVLNYPLGSPKHKKPLTAKQKEAKRIIEAIANDKELSKYLKITIVGGTDGVPHNSIGSKDLDWYNSKLTELKALKTNTDPRYRGGLGTQLTTEQKAAIDALDAILSGSSKDDPTKLAEAKKLVTTTHKDLFTNGAGLFDRGLSTERSKDTEEAFGLKDKGLSVVYDSRLGTVRNPNDRSTHIRLGILQNGDERTIIVEGEEKQKEQIYRDGEWVDKDKAPVPAEGEPNGKEEGEEGEGNPDVINPEDVQIPDEFYRKIETRMFEINPGGNYEHTDLKPAVIAVLEKHNIPADNIPWTEKSFQDLVITQLGVKPVEYPYGTTFTYQTMTNQGTEKKPSEGDSRTVHPGDGKPIYFEKYKGGHWVKEAVAPNPEDAPDTAPETNETIEKFTEEIKIEVDPTLTCTRVGESNVWIISTPTGKKGPGAKITIDEQGNSTAVNAPGYTGDFFGPKTEWNKHSMDKSVPGKIVISRNSTAQPPHDKFDAKSEYILGSFIVDAPKNIEATRHTSSDGETFIIVVDKDTKKNGIITLDGGKIVSRTYEGSSLWVDDYKFRTDGKKLIISPKKAAGEGETNETELSAESLYKSYPINKPYYVSVRQRINPQNDRKEYLVTNTQNGKYGYMYIDDDFKLQKRDAAGGSEKSIWKRNVSIKGDVSLTGVANESGITLFVSHSSLTPLDFVSHPTKVEGVYERPKLSKSPIGKEVITPRLILSPYLEKVSITYEGEKTIITIKHKTKDAGGIITINSDGTISKAPYGKDFIFDTDNSGDYDVNWNGETKVLKIKWSKENEYKYTTDEDERVSGLYRETVERSPDLAFEKVVLQAHCTGFTHKATTIDVNGTTVSGILITETSTKRSAIVYISPSGAHGHRAVSGEGDIFDKQSGSFIYGGNSRLEITIKANPKKGDDTYKDLEEVEETSFKPSEVMEGLKFKRPLAMKIKPYDDGVFKGFLVEMDGKTGFLSISPLGNPVMGKTTNDKGEDVWSSFTVEADTDGKIIFTSTETVEVPGRMWGSNTVARYTEYDDLTTIPLEGLAPKVEAPVVAPDEKPAPVAEPLADAPVAAPEVVPSADQIKEVRAELPEEMRAKATDAKIKEAFKITLEDTAFEGKTPSDPDVKAHVVGWLKEDLKATAPVAEEPATPGLPDGAPADAEELVSGDLPAAFVASGKYYKKGGKILDEDGYIYSYNSAQGNLVYVKGTGRDRVANSPSQGWEQMAVLGGTPNEHLLPKSLQEEGYNITPGPDGLVEVNNGIESAKGYIGAFALHKFMVRNNQIISAVLMKGGQEYSVEPKKEKDRPRVGPLDPDYWNLDGAEEI